MSAPLTPAACVRTRISPAPGSGSGCSSTLSASSLIVTARTDRHPRTFPSTASATMAAMRPGLRVARVLHGRWRRLARADRERLEPLADDVKRRALDLRGEADLEEAQRGLEEASRRLAAGITETAEADRDLTDADLRELREDLARELDRLASADIRASRAEG